MCNKVDYQMQCDFQSLPHNNINRHLKHQSSSSCGFILRNTSTAASKFYQKH